LENILFIADLHALTIPEAISPRELRQKSLEIAGLYLACGIDPKKSIIFLQSDVPAHAYLAWILSCCTPIGWLERMTQFKTKAKAGRRKIASAGSFTYPTLQAADILAYRPDFVPVGEDQKQHVELCRDIVNRFNNLYGNYFRPPELLMRTLGARIMGLDDPSRKMSKSTAETARNHAIGLLSNADEVKRIVSAAVTDSAAEVRVGNSSPGVANLLTIYQCLMGSSQPELEVEFNGKNYGYLKRKVIERVNETLLAIQQRHSHLTADGGHYLRELLRTGAARASEIAESTVRDVRVRVGAGD
jgi:tryptophanyl-tRNA synthetase